MALSSINKVQTLYNKVRTFLYFLVLMLLLNIGKTYSNNLQISNISIPSSSTIQFDITWDNSWYAAAPSNNWDGVWLFVKTQVCASGSSPWSHAALRTISSDHTITGTVLQVDAVSDGMGVFVRRIALGSGNISTTTVVLKFQSTFVAANTNYQVIGIEMVNIPQGAFYLGDGSNNLTSSVNSYGTSQAATPYNVISEAALPADQIWNNLSGSGSIGAHPAIAAGFPKGYNAVYCMKYEISQNQYTTFLNLLEYNQQISRTAVAPSSATGTYAISASGNNRNSIKIKTSGIAFSTPAVYANDLNTNNVFDEAADGQNIAMNYMSWDDLKAYLDWSGLRPMTELEFEKICRGTNSVALTEYAWGTTVISQAISSSLSNSGATNEVSSSANDGLCNYNGGSSTSLGPLRSGYAATSISTRSGAGSSFYGVMDMSGGVFEQCFQTGWYSGSNQRLPVPTFTGTLGNGALDVNGSADATNWAGVAYTIVRGGNWEYIANRCTTSDRFYVNSTAENSTRTRVTGGRGVR